MATSVSYFGFYPVLQCKELIARGLPKWNHPKRAGELMALCGWNVGCCKCPVSPGEICSPSGIFSTSYFFLKS